MNLKPNQALLLREYGKGLPKSKEVKAVTTPPATRMVPSSKKLWADYCMLVTPLKTKGEKK